MGQERKAEFLLRRAATFGFKHQAHGGVFAGFVAHGIQQAQHLRFQLRLFWRERFFARFDLGVGSFDPSSMEILGRNYGGFGVKYFMGGYSCFVLRYNLELVGEFNYVLGGKLHGIYGGRGNSGGDRSDGYNGFSYRLIWGEDGRIYPYLYHYNMGQWGSKLGNGFKLINGVNNIQMAISLNKGSDFFSLIVNNDYYEKEDITFSKKVMPVSGIFFSTFFGGNEEKFGAKNTEKIIFSEFSYKGCKNESD